ncbi:hypothetical protein Thal_1390 [Thermocrinis albus DSM 14484]|uniref:Uncharacterized protein n=1 Tax=Thermocrinis albus (strain DSM 14484 / JCM 11386 / HI 11/12) TaxID=638303 RepID=D3SMP1_THEAH|nr:hypothetical protein [Thermocrinis albus]ADC90021.1 hypothetical protein Thal_1390 [Thermocrinis albus DSM 14484]
MKGNGFGRVGVLVLVLVLLFWNGRGYGEERKENTSEYFRIVYERSIGKWEIYSIYPVGKSVNLDTPEVIVDFCGGKGVVIGKYNSKYFYLITLYPGSPKTRKVEIPIRYSELLCSEDGKYVFAINEIFNDIKGYDTIYAFLVDSSSVVKIFDNFKVSKKILPYYPPNFLVCPLSLKTGEVFTLHGTNFICINPQDIPQGFIKFFLVDLYKRNSNILGVFYDFKSYYFYNISKKKLERSFRLPEEATLVQFDRHTNSIYYYKSTKEIEGYSVQGIINRLYITNNRKEKLIDVKGLLEYTITHDAIYYNSFNRVFVFDLSDKKQKLLYYFPKHSFRSVDPEEDCILCLKARATAVLFLLKDKVVVIVKKY